MDCPDCKNELAAVGGVPTVWQCDTCTKENSLKHTRSPEKRFVGDTLATFRRL